MDQNKCIIIEEGIKYINNKYGNLTIDNCFLSLYEKNIQSKTVLSIGLICLILLEYHKESFQTVEIELIKNSIMKQIMDNI
tara:strand:+ start:4038 stop:4280 length:243 start_codon:yes stop_codon:yes gene_type:complete